jgi:hypothetical protein
MSGWRRASRRRRLLAELEHVRRTRPELLESEIAPLLGVSQATISRLYKALGYCPHCRGWYDPDERKT